MDIQVILLIGLGAVVFGVLVVGLIVRYDLGPMAHLRLFHRVCLALALGSGICAFTIKLCLILGLSSLVIARDITATRLDAVPPYEARGFGGEWKALPDVAPAPANNPTTPEKVALGDRLFHDTRLSPNGTMACASCHDTGKGGTGADGRSVAVGINGLTGKRNAPTVYNAAFQALLFWDGRAHSLEEQAVGPFVQAVEMGNRDMGDVVAIVKSIPDYAPQFQKAFGPDATITSGTIAKAIAAYERTLITPDAPYDRFVRGDRAALTEQQVRGMQLFERVGCVSCHAGPNFSMASVLAPGKGAAGWRPFPARASHFRDQYDLIADRGTSGYTRGVGNWRVPSLRNVAVTGPYFHNGSVEKLTDAVRVMAEVQLGRTLTDKAVADPIIIWDQGERRFLTSNPTPISAAEIEDIAAFLNALTSDRLKQADKADTSPLKSNARGL